MPPSASPLITIRSARRRDLPALLSLWRRSGIRSRVADESRSVEIRLRQDRDLFLLAFAGTRLVGSLIAGWDGWRGSMARLAVDPAYRRRGVANRLLARAEKRLRARGAIRVGALVFSDNKLGARFWEAAGYRKERDVRRFVKNLPAGRP